MSEGERKMFGEYAVSRGVGLFPVGVVAVQNYVDLRPQTHPAGKGMYDLILDQAETRDGGPNAHEMYDYMTPDLVTVFWGVAVPLARRPAYLTLDRMVLYTGPVKGRACLSPPIWPFLIGPATTGKGIAETPSVYGHA